MGNVKEEIVCGISLVNTNVEQVFSLAVQIRIQKSLPCLLPLGIPKLHDRNLNLAFIIAEHLVTALGHLDDGL